MFSRPAYGCARVLLGSQEQRKTLKESLVKRKALRYALKGLTKQGPVQIGHLQSWQEVESALPDSMQAPIERFVAMGRVSDIAYPARERFMTELAKLLAARAWIALTRMRGGECAVAWNYGFRFAGNWFYYQPTLILVCNNILATCFRERVRYQAAAVVKSVPSLENWIRNFLGQASMS